MKRPAKASALIWSLMLVAGAACGDSGAPQVESTATAVTVFIPSVLPWVPDATSMDYRASCIAEGDEVQSTEGALEPAGDFRLEGEGPTAIFKGPIELAPGPCTIQFRLRDSTGEVIFSLTEALEIGAQAPPELYFSMVDSGCPEIPLPDASAVPKRSCVPVGGLILSAETPAAAASIESVQYVLTHANDGFLDGPRVETFEGNLQPAGSGTVDLGGGPIETNLWESIVGVLLAEARHTLEITALDADGTAVCSTATSLDVLTNGIAQAHVIIPCAIP